MESDLVKQLEDKKKEKDCLSSNKAYEEFSKWWENARNIRDEDGDKILEWDKSNIANFCFSTGLRLGLERKQKAEIAILEQAIAEIKNIQSQETKPLEFVETDRGCKPISLTGITRCNSSKDKTADISNLLQKQRQEEITWLVSLNHDLKECNIENIYPTEGYRIDEWINKRIKQLNQPKTETQ